MTNKPYNNGQWTNARFRSFIVSAIRGASQKWQPKWDAINAVFVKKGKNPKTGRPCKLHRCCGCGELFPKGEMRADHVDPVVDPDIGFTTWDEFIERMFVEREGFQAICVGCHKIKSAEERTRRNYAKKKAAGNVAIRRRSRRAPTNQGS